MKVGVTRRGLLQTSALAAGASALGLPVASAQTANQVDLLLVLAVDASASVAGRAYQHQLDGHAAAFRDSRVHTSLMSGRIGAIAATLITWGNPRDMGQPVGWLRLGSAADAIAFADEIDAMSRLPTPGSTGIGAALTAAARVLRQAPFTAPKQVVDISSNGFSNIGKPPAPVRDELIEEGVEINGLPILDQYPWLDGYFEQEVIGGRGAFVLPVARSQDYAPTLLRKLIREIA